MKIKKKKKWAVGTVACEKCGKEWVAVRRIKTKKLECPECGHFTKQYGTVYED